MALPKFNNQGRRSHYGEKVYKIIRSHLYISGFFRLIDPKSFIEDVRKVSPRPLSEDRRGFDFESWRVLKAHLLIRGTYRTRGDQLQLEIYAYYVSSGKLALGRIYKVKQTHFKKIADRFCDDLIKALTGKKSIFSTKIVATVKVRGKKGIYTLDWNGENLEKATSTKFRSLSLSPAWSPKGDKIAFTAYVKHKRAGVFNPDLFLLDLKTKQTKLISHHKGMNSGAVFDPTGKYIYYTLSKRGGAHIYRMNLRTRTLNPIITRPSHTLNLEPDISSDGRHLVFSSNRGGKPMIYMADILARRRVERLTFAGRYNSNPVWSPDGKTIVFASYQKAHYDIYSLALATKQIKKLTSYVKKNGRAAHHASPSFSPDGRFIVFASDRHTTNKQLYLMSSDGGYVRRITFDRHHYETPKWSPYLKP